MEETQKSKIRLVVLVVCSVLSGFLLSYLYTQNTTHMLRVAFFDVGQGDAIWIEAPNGIQILIDGGPTRQVLRALSREMGFFDRTIDMVVMTHEDKDHVGGLPDVFERYEVAEFLRTENQGASTPAELIDSVSEEADIVYARSGMEFDLGEGVLLRVLFPDRDPTGMETNTSSIVMQLTYGSTEFLLTGDSPDEIEHFLVTKYSTGLESDVLKLGHHGSRTSTSEEFVSFVQPEYAIVSSGKDNSYGHPHKEAIEHVTAYGAHVLNTAEEGSIVFETNGSLVTHKVGWYK